ncbi:LysR family transcriptional regulator [Caldisalinibacter kiritimatiensis]|uniref:LysR family transcriptional regulator YeiE n=1 Tax=Caldisalinibacter kiritimatiensis TaxID=1304284 RepID=R1ASD4_9FIRM|nr:LysR family transcriptional regulator [Caldisalinibacter kiritimatiensis]EOC99561.1 LysR family transcriptional regulator YeiE [Caldisalinibacter kiritimatiensis]
MNLQYLKAFYVTVKANSISKAAKLLHLTQPGLSMQIQSLEKELQVNLLNRSNKGVELTEAGRVVFDYANTILSLQENIERDLENLKTDKKYLHIGSCKIVGEYALPCSIYIYKHDNKDVDINVEISNSSQVVENLLDRTVNIGIIQGNVDNKKIVTEKIASDRILLVTSLPLMKTNITTDELRKLPIIFREEGSETRKAVINFLNQYDMDIDDLNIIYELNSMEAIKSSVLAGKGVSFIPELTIKKELKDGALTKIDIEGNSIACSYYIAYRKDHELSVYEKDFISFIKSSKRGFC